jgi:hypothetical protein
MMRAAARPRVSLRHSAKLIIGEPEWPQAIVDDWLWPRCRFAVEESVHDRLQVEQIGERRDTTLAAFIARGERAIGFVELPIRPLFRNDVAAAIWKRNEQELNAAPSQSHHDFEIASLQRMALTQSLHRTGEARRWVVFDEFLRYDPSR